MWILCYFLQLWTQHVSQSVYQLLPKVSVLHIKHVSQSVYQLLPKVSVLHIMSHNTCHYSINHAPHWVDNTQQTATKTAHSSISVNASLWYSQFSYCMHTVLAILEDSEQMHIYTFAPSNAICTHISSACSWSMISYYYLYPQPCWGSSKHHIAVLRPSKWDTLFPISTTV